MYDVLLSVSNGLGTAQYLASDYIVSAPLTMYVATNRTHTAPFDTWAKAATNLPAALAYAANGTTILVSNGTYKVDAQTELALGVTVRGVNGATKVRFNRNSATLMGAPQFRVFKLSHTNAVLDGITVGNGYAYESLLGGPNYQGGGIRMSAGLVKNSTVTACGGNGSGEGGGLYIAGGLVSNCVVSANLLEWGGNGGGVYVAGGAVVDTRVTGNYQTGGNQMNGGGVRLAGGAVRRCSIVNNSAPYGAGLYVTGGTADRCTITNNTAWGTAQGGGAYVAGGTVRNALIAGNVSQRTAADAGGGVYQSGGLVESSTIVNNQATGAGSTGGGVCATAGSVLNSIVYLNTAVGGSGNAALSGAAAMTYSCSTPLQSGAGNVAGNPLFVNAASRDYHIPTASPAANRGSNQGWMSSSADLDGRARTVGPVDMGGYENPFFAATVFLFR